MPTQSELKELFWYRRGNLIWKPRPPHAFRSHSAFVMWNKRYANTIAGSKNARGYIRIAIYKIYYFAHRLIWLYHRGYLPEALDHVNGKPWDNRMSNLRPATQMENTWNRRRRLPTKTNAKGVFKAEDGRYEAHICANKKRYYLGRFVRKSDAIKRVREAREELHKTFARHD